MIIISLINKCPTEVLTILFTPKVMNRLLYHCYSKSINDIIRKIVTKPEMQLYEIEEKNYIFEGLMQNLISSLLQNIIDNDSTDVIISCAQIIAVLADSKTMTEFLCDDSILKKVLQISSRHNPVAVRSGLTIIITLIRVLSEKGNENDPLLIKVKNVILEIFTYLKSLLDQVTNLEIQKDLKKSVEFQKHQHGNDIPVVGLFVIKIVEFFSILIKVKDKEIVNKIAEFNFPTQLLQLFDIYYMHSNLHFKISIFFEEAIKSKDTSLPEFIVKETKLAEYIIEAMKKADINYGTSKKKFPRPNIVFITKIANILVKESESNEMISNHLKSVSEWEKYVKEILSNINKKESPEKPKEEKKFSDILCYVDFDNNQHSNKEDLEKKTDKPYNSELRSDVENLNIIEEILPDEKDDELQSSEELHEGKAEFPQKIEVMNEQNIEQKEWEKEQTKLISEAKDQGLKINEENQKSK